jgi:hypothetical protein
MGVEQTSSTRASRSAIDSTRTSDRWDLCQKLRTLKLGGIGDRECSAANSDRKDFGASC